MHSRQSLFPQNVKERLLEDKAEEVKAEEAKAKRKKGAVAFKASSAMDRSLEDFFNADHEEDEGQEILDSQPIADLFPGMPGTFLNLPLIQDANNLLAVGIVD